MNIWKRKCLAITKRLCLGAFVKIKILVLQNLVLYWLLWHFLSHVSSDSADQKHFDNLLFIQESVPVSHMPHWQHVHYVGCLKTGQRSKSLMLWLSEITRKLRIQTVWRYKYMAIIVYSYIETKSHLSRHPCICTQMQHKHTLTRSNTSPICAGRGAASVEERRWTAFEPLTSVTHPYWWQAANSFTTQRFSKHSIAPGTAGVREGMEDGGDGWMDGSGGMTDE